MVESVQRAHRGPIHREVQAAHGCPANLPECSGSDLGCHPENEDPQPSCPRCDSPHLEYGLHFATHHQDLEGEVAHCRACGWTGEAVVLSADRRRVEPAAHPLPWCGGGWARAHAAAHRRSMAAIACAECDRRPPAAGPSFSATPVLIVYPNSGPTGSVARIAGYGPGPLEGSAAILQKARARYGAECAPLPLWPGRWKRPNARP